MKLCISKKILDKHNLSIEEFMLLYLNYKDYNLKELNNSIINKGYASPNVMTNYKLALSDNDISFINSIIADSSEIVEPKLSRFDALADKLRELYPKGKKDGTDYYWRDSRSIISDRLKKLVAKYGVEFTDEQAITATKNYVDSFNGDYKYMQLLKYFISKNKATGEGAEINSQLLAYIENNGQSENNRDWTAELR